MRRSDDFEDEVPTITQSESMAELMETLRSPGIPTATSDRPTKPIRPIVRRKEPTQP